MPMASSAAGPCGGGRERRREGGATTGRAPPRSRPSPTAPPAPPGAGPAPPPAAARPLPAEPRAPARSLPSVPPRRPPRGPAPPAGTRRRLRAARSLLPPPRPSRPRSARTRRQRRGPLGLAWLRGLSVGDAGPCSLRGSCGLVSRRRTYSLLFSTAPTRHSNLSRRASEPAHRRPLAAAPVQTACGPARPGCGRRGFARRAVTSRPQQLRG